MGAIVDTLMLGNEEMVLIKNEYPNSAFMPLSKEKDIVGRYRVIIPDEIDENYYEFLVSKSIAMSSKNFYWRVKTDTNFSRKMLPRLTSPAASDSLIDGSAG